MTNYERIYGSNPVSKSRIPRKLDDIPAYLQNEVKAVKVGRYKKSRSMVVLETSIMEVNDAWWRNIETAGQSVELMQKVQKIAEIVYDSLEKDYEVWYDPETKLAMEHITNIHDATKMFLKHY